MLPIINPKTNESKIIASIPIPRIRRPDVDSVVLNLRYTKKYNGMNAITEQINPQVNNNHLVFILLARKGYLKIIRKQEFQVFSKPWEATMSTPMNRINIDSYIDKRVT